MPSSYASPLVFHCPSCGRAEDIEIWVIVDVAERPDLSRRIGDGTIHHATCSHCNTQSQLDVPLLIYQPLVEPHLVFSPATAATEDDTWRDLGQLLGQLRQQLAEAWRDEWLKKGIWTVPRSNLTITNVGSPEALQDLAQDFQKIFDDARETFARYLGAPDSAGLAAAVRAWEGVMGHPLFHHKVPADERVFVYVVAGLAYRHRFRSTSSDDDLNRASSLWQQALDTMAPDAPDRPQAADRLADSRYDGYLRTKQLEDLNEVIRLRQEAVGTSSSNSPDRPGYLDRLGLNLRERYDLLNRLDDLDGAIDSFRQVVGTAPADSPDRSGYLHSLGAALGSRYAATKRMEDLVEGTIAFRQAIEARPAETPARTDYLSSLSQSLAKLGGALSSRFEQSGDVRDLEDAIQVYREALDAAPADLPGLPVVRYNLGTALYRRYNQTRQSEDLDEVILLYGQAIVGLPDQPMILQNLGRFLKERHERSGNLADLEESINVFRQAIDALPDGSPSLPELLNRLGGALVARFEDTHGMADLEEAGRIFREVVDKTPAGSSDLYLHLWNLGAQLFKRYEHFGNLEDLDEAVGVLSHAFTLAPADSPHRSGIVINLGFCLGSRYDRLNELDDLKQVIEVFQQALDTAPAGWAEGLIHLGYFTRLLYRRTLQVGDLELAISRLRSALDAMPPSAPGRLIFVNALGLSLLDRYGHDGTDRLERIDEVIRLFQDAVDIGSSDPVVLCTCINNLGNSWQRRYLVTSALDDIDTAIRTWQKAVDTAPANQSERPMYIQNLARGLHRRYSATGRIGDLKEARRLLRKAAQEVPDGSPGRLLCLSNLGLLLCDQRLGTDRLADLDEAVSVSRQAVEEAPTVRAYPYYRPTYIHNLAICLVARYDHSRQVVDIDEAIRFLRQALHEVPADAPSLGNLGAALAKRYQETREPDDLEEVVTACRNALEAALPNSPAWPAACLNLGTALNWRYDHAGQSGDLDGARSAYRDACLRGLDVAPAIALKSAGGWGNWAVERQEWKEAAEAYHLGLRAIEQLFSAQLTRSAKETWLSEAQGLPTRAAYALARAGDLTGAVEALEAGRARLLAEALDLSRRELGRLPAIGHAATHTRYRLAVERWHRLQSFTNQPAQPPSREAGPGFSDEALHQSLTEARRELDESIQAIRQVPGYEDFFRPLDFEGIQQVVADGMPLVYLAVTPKGSVALVVAGPGDYPAFQPIWFDEPADPELAGLGALSADNVVRGTGSSVRDTAAAGGERLSRWLWDAGVGPLVEHLAQRGFSQAVLLPTGLPALLPLHAAWAEDPQVPSGRRYALDTVAFAYAPSARALLQARTIAATVTPDGILAIDNPDGTLRHARQEVEAALSYFPEGRRKVLPGEEATWANVVPELAHYPVLHFSTHGEACPGEPLNSYLLVARDPSRLTLRDILGVRLERARLAILSACETGLPGTQLLDEVIGLPAGLVQAGVAGVVASLWPVDDLATMLLIGRFYERHFREGAEPVLALRDAQCWLRDATALDVGLAGHWQQVYETTKDRQFAREAFRWMRYYKRHPESIPFASPKYWAAFTYTGV